MQSDSNWRKAVGQTLVSALIASALATVSTWYWQHRSERKVQENTALVLRQAALNEWRLCNETKSNITEIVTHPLATNEGILPEAFDALHRPALYLDVRSKVVELPPGIVNATVHFDFALQQAQLYRDLTRKWLAESGTKANGPQGNWQVYFRGLDLVTDYARALVVEIDKTYPRLKSVPNP